ncbi:preprotein translocase subunit YajC [Bacteroidota bacterium]
MNDLLYILLMGAPQEGAAERSPYSSLIFFGLIAVIFYFFMIRPQMKKQKDLKKYREEIKKGDKIITAGGIYGKIIEVKDTAVIIEVEDQSKLKIDKNSIVRNVGDGEIEKK